MPFTSEVEMLELVLIAILFWVIFRFWKRSVDKDRDWFDQKLHRKQGKRYHSFSPNDSGYSIESYVEYDEELTQPDGYDSWYEALNRPVTQEHLFWIEYCDRDGVITEREIVPKSIHLQPKQSELLIKAQCNLRGEERSFYTARIQDCKNLQTNRKIKNLGVYLRDRY